MQSPLLMLALLLAPALTAQQKPAPLPPAAEPVLDLAAEQEIFRLANEQRTRAGLPPFASDDRLTRGARTHSFEMAKQQRVGHLLPGEPPLEDRLARTGLNFSLAAENVTLAWSADQAHKLFLGSAPHRANLLSRQYDTLGIAVTRRDHQFYVTQNFARRLKDYPVEDFEAEVVGTIARLRGQSKLPGLARFLLPEARPQACAIAASGGGENESIAAMRRLHLPVSMLSFSAASPQPLPPEQAAMAAEAGIRRFIVGACTGPVPGSSRKQFWVVVAFYR